MLAVYRFTCLTFVIQEATVILSTRSLIQIGIEGVCSLGEDVNYAI